MATLELVKLQRRGLTRTDLGGLILSGVRYLFETEVHAYAFSIAANAFLSFFPFNLILLAICRRWLHWEKCLPDGPSAFARTPSHRDGIGDSQSGGGGSRAATVAVGIRIHALFHQLGRVSSARDRPQQGVGIPAQSQFPEKSGSVFCARPGFGVLALIFILAVTPLQAAITFLIGWIPSGSPRLGVGAVLEIASVPFVASIYFMIYYFLPNGKVPVARVLPAAIATGILTEMGRGHIFLTLPMFRFREVYGPFALS